MHGYRDLACVLGENRVEWINRVRKSEMAADMNRKPLFYRLVNSVIRIVLWGAVFLLLLHSLFSTSFVGRVFLEDGSEQERSLNIADSPLRHLLLFLFVTVSVYLLRVLWQSAKERGRIQPTARGSRLIFWGLLLFTLISVSAFVLMTQFVPGSDPAKVYAVAMQWRRGDYSAFAEDAYLFRYPFQAGIVLFLYLLSFPFGMGNYVAIQLVYVVCLVAVYGLLAKLSDYFWPGKGLRNLVCLGLVCWMPLAFYVTYLYGILPGMALSLGAVWFAACYFSKRRYRYIALSSLCMGLATVIKMNCLIFLIGIACFLAYDILDLLFLSKEARLSKKDRQKYGLASLLFILSMAVSVGLCNWCSNRVVERITGQELKEGIPMLTWVVMGLQDAPLGPGGYNGYISNIFTETGFDGRAAEEDAKVEIQKRVEWMLEDKLKNGIPFLARKTAFQWNDPTFICLDRTRGREAAVSVPTPLKSLIYGRGSVKFSVLCNDMQSLILLGVLLYLLLRWNSRNLYELMGAVIFLGGYLFHLVWESSSSYTIPYFVLLIPYAVCGMAEWAAFVERQFARLRGMEWDGAQAAPAEMPEQEAMAGRRRKTGKMLTAALAVGFFLLVFAFTRTNLFDRSIALNDDLQGFDASDQFYHRNVWKIGE